jgi:predicted GNAT family N-acyltransferase
MLSVLRFNYSDTELYRQSYQIRKIVFLEEQKADPEVELDHEEECRYYLLVIDNQPVATARWRETKEGIKLERFAILEDYRKLGYGSFLLDEVMADVIGLGKKIYLHAQVQVVDFYRRKGFIPGGKSFSEAGILHFKMSLLTQTT